MSKIRLTPNTSGTGTVTLTVPSTNTDRTISLPDTAGNVVTTGDSGTITAPMLDGGQTGSAPALVVRARLRMNGTGTISITDSVNISSITDLSTGRYQMSFTTAMSSATYSVAVSTVNKDSGFYSAATGTCNLWHNNYSAGGEDTSDLSAIVVG